MAKTFSIGRGDSSLGRANSSTGVGVITGNASRGADSSIAGGLPSMRRGKPGIHGSKFNTTVDGFLKAAYPTTTTTTTTVPLPPALIWKPLTDAIFTVANLDNHYTSITADTMSVVRPVGGQSSNNSYVRGDYGASYFKDQDYTIRWRWDVSSATGAVQHIVSLSGLGTTFNAAPYLVANITLYVGTNISLTLTNADGVAWVQGVNYDMQSGNIAVVAAPFTRWFEMKLDHAGNKSTLDWYTDAFITKENGLEISTIYADDFRYFWPSYIGTKAEGYGGEHSVQISGF